jgi:hypothetical protein
VTGKLFKGYGREESIQVVIHMCMEAVIVIFLYSYPYLKLAKTLCLSYYCLCLLFNKIGIGGEMEWCWVGGGRDGPNNECTYEEMNK